MDGTLVGDLEQAAARRLVHVAGDFDLALDAVDPAVPGFTGLAILGMDRRRRDNTAFQNAESLPG